MSPRLVRIIAVVLTVLGVLPFTAPFPTFDLGILTGHSHQAPSANHVPHGAMLKTATDPDKVPMLAVSTALATSLFAIVVAEAATPIARVSSARILLQGLRV